MSAAERADFDQRRATAISRVEDRAADALLAIEQRNWVALIYAAQFLHIAGQALWASERAMEGASDDN